jgi:hypothetical protein
VASGAGLVSLRRFLASFDLPDWNGFDLLMDGVIAVPTVLIAVSTTWSAVRHHRSAVYGDKLPAVSSPEELARFEAVCNTCFAWVLAFLLLLDGIAYLDGFAKIGLIGLLIGLAFESILSAILAVGFASCALMWRRLRNRWWKSTIQTEQALADGEPRAAVPRKGLLWLTVFFAAAAFVAVEASKRFLSGSWPRAHNPDTTWDFFIAFSREKGGSGEGDFLFTFGLTGAVLLLSASAARLRRAGIVTD